MLARLQRTVTIGLLTLAVLWSAFAWRYGHPMLALAGALLLVFGYALFLAVEFALLHHVHGDDPAPPASPTQLFVAWWGEVRSAPLVFCWRQPFFSRRWPDHLPTDATGRRGLLLVHGFVCNRGLWNPWLARLKAQGIPYVAVDLEPVFGSIDDYALTIQKGVQRLERATGRAPVIVAHSMGGLAVRRWWADHGDDDERVRRVVTIATPHSGTWLARFALTSNARQMRQHSTWLSALMQQEPASRMARFTCFYGHCDNISFPASTGTLAGADNRHLPGVAHVHMASRPEPWNEVQRWLS